MLRRLILAALLACLPFAGANALTCSAYPFTLTNGTLADANQVMANFNSILNCANTLLAPLTAPVFIGPVTINGTPLGHASGGTDVTSPGTRGNVLLSNGTNWTSSPGQTQTVTSAYTAQPSDCQSTIYLGGASNFGVTVNAATGYGTVCVITFIDSDSRGKMMTINGVPGFQLFPTQTVTLERVGSAWRLSGPGRWAVDCANSLTSGLCPNTASGYGVFIYVDTTNGNDNNDCLATGTGACKTIGAAKQIIYGRLDLGLGGYPVISIANGTYTETVNFQGAPVGGVVTFINAPGGSVTWKPGATGVCLQVGDGGIVEVGLQAGPTSGITFDNTGGAASGIGIFVHQTSIVDVNGATFGNWLGGEQAYVDRTGDLNFNFGYTISGSAATHVLLGPGATFIQSGAVTITFSGSPTISTLYQGSGAGFTFSIAPSVTYSGAAAISQACGLTGPGAASLNGNTPPGTNNCASGVSHGAQVF
jgi:hypothetical protein